MATAENSTGAAPQRMVGRPFEKGRSGNPGGRPRGLRAKVREFTRDGEEMIELLAETMRDTSEPTKVRLEAARELLDRGFGKALNSSVTIARERAADNPVDALDPDEVSGLLDQLRELRATRAAMTNGDTAEASGDA